MQTGLKDCANTIVGDRYRRGVSGGEKRRVSLGSQLLTNPSLIFLDEVTSGLDSFSALHIAQTLRILAKQGRNIVMSIHQPRSEVFALIDTLILLSRGRVVYAGPTTKILEYLSTLGTTCPHESNPADFIIDASSLDTRDAEKEEKSKGRVDKLIQSWEDCGLAFAPEIAAATKFAEATPASLPDKVSSKQMAFLKFWNESIILYTRNKKNLVRDAVAGAEVAGGDDQFAGVELGRERGRAFVQRPAGELPGVDRAGRLNLFLQVEDRANQLLRPRRTTGDIHIDGDEAVDALHHGVGVEHAAG